MYMYVHIYMYTKHFILTWIKAYYVQCFLALGCLKSLLKTLRTAFRYIKMAKHPLLQSSARHWCILIEISLEEHKHLTTDLEGSSPQACLPSAHSSLATLRETWLVTEGCAFPAWGAYEQKCWGFSRFQETGSEPGEKTQA